MLPSPGEVIYPQTAFVKRHVKRFCEAPRSMVIFAEELGCIGLNCVPMTSAFVSLCVLR